MLQKVLQEQRKCTIGISGTTLALTLLVIPCLFVHFFAWFTRSAEFNDGAGFVFSALDQAHGGLLYINDRITGALIQAPSSLALKYFGFESAYRFAFEYLHAVYLFMPWIGLLVTITLLVRGRREDLIPFPILSYGLITLGTLHFAFSTVQETTTAFWVLFALLARREERFSKVQLFWIAAFSLFLGLGYEPVVILFPMLLWMCYRRKQAIWLCALGLLPLLIRYWRLRSYGDFWHSLLKSLVAPHFQFVALSLFLLMTLAVLTKLKAGSRWAFAVVLFQLGNSLLWLCRSDIGLDGLSSRSAPESFYIRAPALPLLAVLAVIATWYQDQGRKKDDGKEPGLPVFRSLTAFAASSLLVGLLFNFSATRVWQRSRMELRGLMDTLGPGCHVISYKENWRITSGISGVFMPYVTLLMQNPKSVDRILFSDDGFSRQYQGDNPCARGAESGRGAPAGLIWAPKQGNFDFSKIFMRTIHASDYPSSRQSDQ